MSVESLRPLIRRFGFHLRKAETFLQEVRLGFSNVISTLAHLNDLMPQLVQIYVSEMFSNSEIKLFNDYHEILNQQCQDKDKIKMRICYQKTIKNRIDYFKQQLRETLYSENNQIIDESCSDDTNSVCDSIDDNASIAHASITPATLGSPLPKGTTRSNIFDDTPPNVDIASRTRNGTKNGVSDSSPETHDSDKLQKRSLTNRKPLMPKPPEIVETKQSLKRKRKRYVKKLLATVLNFRQTKNVKHSHYYAYVNEKLAHHSSEAMTKYFEEEGGFLAFSMVSDLRAITPDELQIISVFENIRKRYTKELTTNRNRRLINKASGGVYSTNYTTQDDLRRAVSISFGPAVKSLQILVDYYVQQFINLGLVHPDTKAGNALGKLGIELLFKGSGLDDQVPHFDFPNFKRTKKFLSYRHSMEQKVVFDERLDGGCSLFINHTDKEDTLCRPDGTLIVIPPYSFCILRGNVAHHGTGNSEDDAIYKFFCYLDPVKYYRATNKYKVSQYDCFPQRLSYPTIFFSRTVSSCSTNTRILSVTPRLHTQWCWTHLSCRTIVFTATSSFATPTLCVLTACFAAGKLRCMSTRRPTLSSAPMVAKVLC
jgi:hypothetical protein